MKPTPEQLKDPKWWDETAHEKATHIMRRKGFDDYEFAFLLDYEFYCDPDGDVSFVIDDSDDSAWVVEAERPTHSVDATEKVAGKKPKQERFQDANGEDFLDECMRTMTPEQFRGAMMFTIGKYIRRLGKKDDIAKEVYKVADYGQRWLEYEESIKDEPAT